MTVTTERPALETDRTCSSRGSPRIAISTGNVTNRSTSGGDIPGDVDRTSTWMLVTSGKASIGMCRVAQTPRPTRTRTPKRTRALFLSEDSTIRSTKPMLVPYERALAQLGLQQEAARGDHGLAVGNALEDLNDAVEPLAELDRAPGEGPLSRLDEDDGLASVVLDRLLGEGERAAIPTRPDRGFDVHARLQPSAGVGHLDAALDGPRRGVHDVADKGQAAAELLSRIGLGLQDDLIPGLEGPEVFFLDMQAGPERRRISQPEEAGPEIDRVARDHIALDDGPAERGVD